MVNLPFSFILRFHSGASMPAFAGIWLAIVTISVNVVRADTAASAPSGFFRSSGVNDVLASQAEPLIRQTSEIDDPLASPPLPSPAEATASFEYPALEEQFTATPDFPNEQPDFASRVIGSCEPCCSPTHEVMPVGLLYRSYIAAPHEPRMSSTLLYDTSAHESRWDSTLGGRIGLYRRNNPDNMNLDAWQIDVEGAVMVRLDPGEQMDLESSDYRFGLLWTGRRDNISYKAGYFHISSHVGDEYQIKNPLFQRINFVRESLIVGTAIQMTPEVRTYIEAAYAVAYHGGAKPFQVQYGAEYVRVPCRPGSKTPFVAANFQHRQEVDFEAGINLMTGYQWTGPNTGRTMRIGLQYFNGPTNQYQFIGRYDNQLGFGIWVDY